MIFRQTDVNTVRYQILEKLIAAKSGRMEDCEDRLHISEHFLGVIDGATGKTPDRWDGATAGQKAAEIIDRTFANLPTEATAPEAVNAINQNIQQWYQQRVFLEVAKENPSRRLTACFAAVSMARRELWMVGDCQALLGKEHVHFPKIIDKIAAAARAVVLQNARAKGITEAALRENDPGRRFILPLLKAQAMLQNNDAAGAFGYPVIDGFPLVANGAKVLPIPENTEIIVLASDGYPQLKSELAASEACLEKILQEDPMFYKAHFETKGKLATNVSFDDRSFLKIQINAGKEDRTNGC